MPASIMDKQQLVHKLQQPRYVPPEVWDQVLAGLDKNSLLSVRFVSRQIASLAARHLFSQVTVSRKTSSLNKLRTISESEMSKYVLKLRVCPDIKCSDVLDYTGSLNFNEPYEPPQERGAFGECQQANLNEFDELGENQVQNCLKSSIGRLESLREILFDTMLREDPLSTPNATRWNHTCHPYACYMATLMVEGVLNSALLTKSLRLLSINCVGWLDREEVRDPRLHASDMVRSLECLTELRLTGFAGGFQRETNGINSYEFRRAQHMTYHFVDDIRSDSIMNKVLAMNLPMLTRLAIGGYDARGGIRTFLKPIPFDVLAEQIFPQLSEVILVSVRIPAHDAMKFFKNHSTTLRRLILGPIVINDEWTPFFLWDLGHVLQLDDFDFVGPILPSCRGTTDLPGTVEEARRLYSPSRRVGVVVNFQGGPLSVYQLLKFFMCNKEGPSIKWIRTLATEIFEEQKQQDRSGDPEVHRDLNTALDSVPSLSASDTHEPWSFKLSREDALRIAALATCGFPPLWRLRRMDETRFEWMVEMPLRIPTRFQRRLSEIGLGSKICNNHIPTPPGITNRSSIVVVKPHFIAKISD